MQVLEVVRVVPENVCVNGVVCAGDGPEAEPPQPARIPATTRTPETARRCIIVQSCPIRFAPRYHEIARGLHFHYRGGMSPALAVERSPQGFPVKQPVERLLAETAHFALGTFSCATDAPFFRDSGPSTTFCFAFPRTHVGIRHADGTSFLAGPAVVTMYNEGQEYERWAVSCDGDRCDWIAVRPAILEDALSAVAPSAVRGSRRLFPTSHVVSTSAAFLRQRHLFERLTRAGRMEPLELDETVLRLLELVLRDACRGARPLDAPTSGQRVLVQEARLMFARQPERRWTLGDLANRLQCSVFHLCRTFRRIEGLTLHGYLVRLRLRLALEGLADAGGDVTRLALEAGFCSHSHFSAAFRREFGITPSRFVQSLSGAPSWREE